MDFSKQQKIKLERKNLVSQINCFETTNQFWKKVRPYYIFPYML